MDTDDTPAPAKTDEEAARACVLAKKEGGRISDDVAVEIFLAGVVWGREAALVEVDRDSDALDRDQG